MTRGDIGLEASTSRSIGGQDDRGVSEQGGSQSTWQTHQGENQQQQNVGENERAVSVAAGAIAAMTGLGRGGLPGLLITAVGGGLIYRGISGHCPVYQSLDVNTAEDTDGSGDATESSRNVRIATAFLINRSPEDLYGFWRNFENLPQIMTHLESVRVLDERRSHWIAKAPNIGGKQFEWDAEIIAEEAGRSIAWQSLPGGDVETSGEIRFEPHGGGDRGTNVHVTINYIPPGGRIGHWMAKMLGENPTRVVREDLRNFKRLMETGELPTIVGQSRGTCTGQGKREPESEWKPLFT